MAKSLQGYLEIVKDIPKKQVVRLFIDDCGMRDEQLANILKGVVAQGEHIRTFVYGNNELGNESII